MTLINHQAIDKLVADLSTEIAVDIIDAFIGQVKGFMQEITSAEMDTRGRIVHTLKGDSPLVGANSLARLARELDNVYKSQGSISDEQCQTLSVLGMETLNELNQVKEALP